MVNTDVSCPPSCCMFIFNASIDAAFRALWYAVSGHGISECLIEDTFEQCKRFFSLPEADKRTIVADENNRQGCAGSTTIKIMLPMHPGVEHWYHQRG